MNGVPASPRRGRRRLVPALLPALLLPALTACGDDPPDAPYDAEAGVVDGIQHALRQRARAIVNRDAVAFDHSLAQRKAGFVAEQDRYFDNLGQLPLGTVRFDVAEKSLEPDGDAYWAEVTIRLELQGYDVAPVITRDRWRFAPTQRRAPLPVDVDHGREVGNGGRPPAPAVGPR